MWIRSTNIIIEFELYKSNNAKRIIMNDNSTFCPIFACMKHVCLLILSLYLCCHALPQPVFTHQDKPLRPDESRFYVCPALSDAELLQSPYAFRSLKEALLAAEKLQTQQSFSESNPLAIYISPSVYWLDDPDDPEVRKPRPGESIPYGMELKLSHLRLIGLGNRPEEVILASNRGQTQGAEGNFTMLHFEGSDIQAENLTFGNYCNIDLDYPLNPTLNRKKRADAIVQAQLIICRGDRITARNCRFISRLNSCPFAGAERALFDNCYFECTDDALCGTGVYLNCRFTLFSGKPFYSTQGTGAVFLNCDLHSLTNGRQYLVKVGSPVSMVDCRWTSMHPSLFIGWTQDPTADLRSYQSNLTLNGKALYINADKPWLTVDMTDKPVLNAYRIETPEHLIIYNVYNLLRGNDDWDPLHQKETLEKLGKQMHNSDTYYTQLPMQLRLSHRAATLESGVDSLHLHSRPLRFATKTDSDFTREKNVRWSLAPEDSAFVTLQGNKDGSCLVRGSNSGEEARTVNILTSTDDGLEAACVVNVLPRQLPPPAFVRLPSIKQEGEQLIADYQLDLGMRADQSLITWYRCTSSTGEGAIAVAVSRLNRPKQRYALTASDSGYYIRASVAPKHLRSLPGKAASAITAKPINISRAGGSRSLSTDFLDFPTDYQPRIIPGFWTVDAHKPIDTKDFDWQPDTTRNTWLYGRGVDGAAHSIGLLQAMRGARLLYTPLPARYGNMSVTLTVDPCKTAGQGFGSATGQYIDVYIKFDTQTLSGYALRIVRTTKNDKAVDFQLMKYENGIATPITKPVSAICYRTGCTLHLKVEGNHFSAHAETSTPLPAPHRPGLVTVVDLEADIAPNAFGGIGIQHTGSTGASATMLRNLEVTWE